jgi:cellulose synthase/poly-beta-1,6-N-acetylglucosamine synthase-like glycosyltransferase
VQIGVRMTNTDRNVLTRMQDMEFVVFTEVFQRARTRFGTAGMGGNGQFVRLSALRSLGPDPWSDCLTEDLDLGLRLVERGWRTMFVATTAVHQQAVDDLKRLMRQRTRWFQGHLQCWPHLWRLVRSKAPAGPAVDLSLHLLASMAMIGMGMVTASLVVGLVAVAMQSPAEAWAALTAGGPGRILLAYLCTFGLCWVYGFVYWLRTPSVRFHTALLLAHAYLLYGFMWVVVGVRAVVRQALGRRGWAKTARSADAAALPVPSR